jgi:hypothetical protein
MALSAIPLWVGDLSKTSKTKLESLRTAVEALIADLDPNYVPPLPPPPIVDDPLYFQNWEDRFNQIITNLEAYKVADRTASWNKMTISISSYTKVMDSEKQPKPLLDLVKADVLIDFGGIIVTIGTLNLQNLLLTDLDGMITQSANAVTAEVARIDSFSAQTNAVIQTVATNRLLKDPGTLSVINDTLGTGTAYRAFGIMQ